MIKKANKKNLAGRFLVAGFFVLVISLSFVMMSPVKALTNTYDKVAGSQLTPQEWNNLLLDFLNTDGGRINGPLGIGTSTNSYALNVNGTGYFSNSVVVGSPTEDNHAATVSFVNSVIGGGVTVGTLGQTLRHNGTNWEANSVLFNNGNNIGIGTTTPATKLDVLGNIRANGLIQSLQSGGNYMFTMDATNGAGPRLQLGTLASPATFFEIGAWGNINNFDSKARDLKLYSNGGGFIFLQNTSGNVGVATTTPSQKLHVAGGAQLDAISFGVTPGSTQTLALSTVEYVNTKVGGTGGVGPGSTGQTLRYNGTGWVADSNIFNTATNVGIGTTNPLEKLHLGSGNIKLESNSTIVAETNSIKMYDGGTGSLDIIAQTNGPAARGINLMSGAVTALRIDKTGNVGIGTTAPVNALQVKSAGTGPGVANGGLAIQTTADGANPAFVYADLPFMDNTGRTVSKIGSFMNTSLGGGLYFVTNNNYGGSGTERMRILASGNVGIATTTPTQKLHVAGGAQLDAVSFGVTPGSTQTLALSTVEYVNAKVGGSGGVGPGSTGQTLRYNGTGWVADSNLFNTATNVGIGTTGPGAKLHIKQGGDFTGSGGSLLHIGTSVITNTSDLGAMISVDDAATASPQKAGLILYNNNATAGGWSPMFLFAKKESGGSPYQATMAGIAAKAPLGTGNGDSWIDGELHFYTSGAATSGLVDRMVINSNGNVGIGTTAPGYLLDVGSNSLIANTFINVNADWNRQIGYKLSSNGVQQWLMYEPGSSNDLRFQDKTGDRVTIQQTTGNVGVGTTTPSQKLHVAGGAQLDAISFGVTPGSTQTLALSTVEYVNAKVGGSGGVGAGITGQTLRHNGTGWVADSNLFNTATNVGIGTTAPSQKLDVQGNLAIGSNMLGGGSIYGYSGGASYATLKMYDSANGYTLLNNQGYGIKLQTAGSDRMTILNNGNIGIGTTGPDAKLVVRDDSVGGGMLTRFGWAAAGTSPLIRFSGRNTGDTTSYHSDIKLNAENGILTLMAPNNVAPSVNALNIISGGNVGIGTTTPSQKFHVAGGAQLDAISFGVTPGSTQTLALSTVEYVNAKVGGSAGVGAGINGQTLRHNGTGWIADSNLFNTGTNVGIGITSPNKTLQVMGGLAVDSGFNAGVASLYLSHTGNSNQHKAAIFTTYTTGFGRSSSMQFAMNNVMDASIVTTSDSKMTILEGGNVGIGTTNPGTLLHLNSSQSVATIQSTATDAPSILRLQNSVLNSNATAGQIQFSNTSANVLSQISGNIASAATDGYLIFSTRNSNVLGERVRIANNGNVGVSTTTPSQKFHVAGGAQLDAVSFGVTPGSTQTLALSTVEYVNAKVGGSAGVGAGIAGQTLRHNGTGWVADSNLFNNGTNVGIGTTNPSTALDISNSNFPALSLHRQSNGVLYGSGINFDLNNVAGTRKTYATMYGGISSNAVGAEEGFFQFQTSKVGALTDAMRITKDGNVGIGTTNPVDKLNVSGVVSVNSGGSYRLYNAAGNGWAEISFDQVANLIQVQRGIKSSDGAFKIGMSGQDSYLNSISGNVGISTTTPSQKLHVAGGAQLDAVAFGVTPGSSQILALSTVEYVNAMVSGTATSSVGFWTQLGNNISNNNIGNVGIGTTTAAYKLDVDGTFKATANSSSIILNSDGDILIGI